MWEVSYKFIAKQIIIWEPKLAKFLSNATGLPPNVHCLCKKICRLLACSWDNLHLDLNSCNISQQQLRIKSSFFFFLTQPAMNSPQTPRLPRLFWLSLPAARGQNAKKVHLSGLFRKRTRTNRLGLRDCGKSNFKMKMRGFLTIFTLLSAP